LLTFAFSASSLAFCSAAFSASSLAIASSKAFSSSNSYFDFIFAIF